MSRGIRAGGRNRLNVRLIRNCVSSSEQIKNRNARLAEDPDASELVTLGAKLVADLDATEEKIHNPHAEVDYDILARGHKSVLQLHRFQFTVFV